MPTALFIEDDLIAAELWSTMLVDNGYIVHYVRTPAECISLLDSTSDVIDVIVLDFQLPLSGVLKVENGLRAGFGMVQMLREYYSKIDLECPPIIGLTNRSDYVEEIRNLNIFAILEKRVHHMSDVLDEANRAIENKGK